MRESYLWIIVCGMLAMALGGVVEWRKEQRLEAVKTACLANHTVAECKELK